MNNENEDSETSGMWIWTKRSDKVVADITITLTQKMEDECMQKSGYGGHENWMRGASKFGRRGEREMDAETRLRWLRTLGASEAAVRGMWIATAGNCGYMSLESM